MIPTRPIYIQIREKWGHMAETLVKQAQGQFRGRVRVVSLDDATLTLLASDPLVTVQLPEGQTERVRELDEHGPARH